ncbi:hypothetical protein PCYB_005670, partial [Plasmodium cynomolgi strain B]
LVLYDDLRNRRELYEYCVDYSSIYKLLPYYPQKCEEFYKYVESKKRLYKYFKQLCYSSDENKCPNFYSQCEQYDPEIVLRTLPCHRDKINEEVAHVSSDLQREKLLSDRETVSRQASVGMGPVGTIFNGKFHTVTKVGNILLGVVATSMTSGALYRVNINSLIQIYCIRLLISIITSP